MSSRYPRQAAPDPNAQQGGGGQWLQMLMPIIAGIAGAATPGLGRGVGLALSAYGAQQEAKRQRMFAESVQRDARAEEKMKATGRMLLEKDAMPAIPQGRTLGGNAQSFEPDRMFSKTEDDKNYWQTVNEVNPKGLLDYYSGARQRQLESELEADQRAQMEMQMQSFIGAPRPSPGTAITRDFGPAGKVAREGVPDYKPEKAEAPYEFKTTGKSLIRIDVNKGKAEVVYRDPDAPRNESRTPITEATLSAIASGTVFPDIPMSPKQAEEALGRLQVRDRDPNKNKTRGNGKTTARYDVDDQGNLIAR